MSQGMKVPCGYLRIITQAQLCPALSPASSKAIKPVSSYL